MLDGAMGTALYQLGCFINRSFDEANLTAPQKVAAVHEAHINAGAEVIETNTFRQIDVCCQSMALLIRLLRLIEPVFSFFFPHFFSFFLFSFQKTGVRLARKAVDDSRREVYVAGAKRSQLFIHLK